MDKQKITVIGHYGMSFLMDVQHFPAVGETVEGVGLEIEPGGKGFNQAIASSRLGAEVDFITAVGGDDYGKQCSKDLEAEHIAGKYIIELSEEKSACAFVLNNANAESQVFVYPGAIRKVTPEHIEQYREVIENSSLILIQNEVSVDALCKVITIAGEAGIEIIYNPAPARKMPWEIFKYINIMTPNETEAAILAGYDPVKPLKINCVLKKLHEFGVKNVLITMGEKGSIVSTPNGVYQIKPLEGQVVSTTGAGDCYNAALAVKYAETKNILEAAQYASIASGLQVQRSGVITNLPYKEEVDLIYEGMEGSMIEKVYF